MWSDGLFTIGTGTYTYMKWIQNYFKSPGAQVCCTLEHHSDLLSSHHLQIVPITPLLNAQFAICRWGHTDASRWTKLGLWVPGTDIVIRPIPFSIDPTLSSSTFPWRRNFQHINTRLEHFVPDPRHTFTTAANTHLTRSSDAGVNQRATWTPILHYSMPSAQITAERV